MNKFAEKVSSFLKSFGGANPKDEEKKDEDGSDDPDLDLDGDGDNDDGDGDEVKKSDADLLDATDVLKALVGELKTVNKSLAAIAKRQDGVEKAQADLGEAVVGVAELVSKVANTPLPQKTVMAKGGLGNETAGGGNPSQLSQAEFEQAQVALTKAFQGKRITIHQAARLESEMQKAMQLPGYRMKPEDAALIAKELKTA